MKITYEDPLKHLVSSFDANQRFLWEKHLKKEKIRCVTAQIISSSSAGRLFVESYKGVLADGMGEWK